VCAAEVCFSDSACGETVLPEEEAWRTYYSKVRWAVEAEV